MKSKFFKSYKSKVIHNASDVPIPITSLADIFIILLVFLLKGFVSGSLNITLSSGMKLPQAFADQKGIEALKVEISSKAILIESKPIVRLEQFKLSTTQEKANELKALNDTFELERKRQTLISKSNTDVQVDQKLIVLADEKAPYDIIKTVLTAAANHGYTDYKLAVIQKE